MARVNRIDVGQLAKPIRRADGTLIAQAKLARSGVQSYADPKMPDGMRREYRPPNAVFDQDSLDSFKLVPVTNDHPPEMLNAENASRYSVGAVGQDIHRDGDWMVATIAVHDATTIRAMESGKAQVSNGYDCDLIMQPGTSPEGERYDAIQSNIVGNHLAIVHSARAGRDAAVRMDALSEYNTENDMSESELKLACLARGARYDADDEKGSALALLAKLGYPGSHKTTNGQRLDARSVEYLTARAVGAAEYNDTERDPNRFATVRSAHVDDERQDGQPYLDDDGNGTVTLIDPRRNQVMEDLHKRLVDERQTSWLDAATNLAIGETQEQYKKDYLEYRALLDRQMADALERQRAANIANPPRDDWYKRSPLNTSDDDATEALRRARERAGK